MADDLTEQRILCGTGGIAGTREREAQAKQVVRLEPRSRGEQARQADTEQSRAYQQRRSQCQLGRNKDSPFALEFSRRSTTPNPFAQVDPRELQCRRQTEDQSREQGNGCGEYRHSRA